MHYLGIDWATEKHDLCLMADDGRVLSQFEITHDMDGFNNLYQILETITDDIQINIERSNGLLVDWLVQQEYDLYMTPPHVLASRRPTRVKDDKGDAFLLAYLLRFRDPDCRPYTSQSSIVSHLQQLTRHYERVLVEQRRLSNQLIMCLRQYYPLALSLFSRVNALISLAFLEKYPTPQAAEQITYSELEDFLIANHYCRRSRLDLIYKRLQVKMPHATVQAGFVEQVKMLVPLIRLLHYQKKSLIKEIQQVFQQHPEADWWLTFPGTKGPLTAAFMLAWIGDDRSRFPTANVLQAYAGTVPVTRRSGKSRSIHFRKACSHPTRRAADNFARQTRRHSGWARAYFHEQLARGHSAARANRALANRWMKIIWTLWQRREPYDEAVHVANRSRKGQCLPVVAAAD